MKKIITFLALVISFAGMSQGLTVTTDKTPSQLINEVLVNSPCFIATNVTASTGSNFGSTNGIGYFSNINPNNPNLLKNPNFPFTSGVVLTTGDVTKVPSPNNAVLSDGVAAWPGDTEMQIALLSQGININSVNASYLQFEFIATTTTFSISFIFASEEYGASQCNYSDAFAFLIKNITIGGAYQNLGTVPAPAPAGTPVTVDKIRDAQYNPNCSSVNPNFFGAYNGGGFGPAINFDGQTVPMTASAPLIVGNTYRVKLVIADGNNNVGNDSAIFLEAKNLNIDEAEILGLDYVSANANAVPPRNGLCSTAVAGSCPILQPAVPLPAGTTYQWKKRLSGVFQNIPGQTSPTLDVCALTPTFNAPEIGLNYYSLTYTRPGCVAITDIINVEVFQPINALAVLPAFTKCNTGAANYSFDLTTIANIITTNNTPAFINDDLFGYTITFHTSITNAENNIAVNSTYSVSSGSLTAGVLMYAKIKNNISGCYVVRSFDLKVVAPPTIVQPPLDLTLCAETPSPEPRASFDLNNNLSLMLGTQDQSIYSFSYHNSQFGAVTSTTTDAIFVPLTNIKNTKTIIIYIRLQNILDPSCFLTTSFTLTVTPLAYVDILPDVIVCNNFVLPVLTQPGSQYWSLTGGADTAGNMQYYAGDVILPGVTPTTIWVYNENGICKTNDSFSVTKADLQTIAPVSVTVCQTDPFTLPPLAYGTYYMLAGGPSIPGQTAPPANLFDTPGVKTIFVWFESLTETPVCAQQLSITITITPYTLIQESDYPDKFACTSYTLSTPAGNGANYYNGPGGTGGMISLPFTYSTANSQKTIYVIKESGTIPNCTSETSFTIFIGLSGGGFTAPSNVNSCIPYTLPTLDFGKYRTAPNGGGAMYPPEAVISAIGTTTIYFYVPGQPCTSNLSFDVTIGLELIAPILDVVVCDLYALPYIASHPNGKYYTGPLGTGIAYNNSLTSPGIIYALGTQTIYFYDQLTSGQCYVQDDFQLTINPSPPISQRPISVVTCNQYYVLEDLQFGEYYKFPGGPSPTNPILPPGFVIPLNDVGLPYCEIYVYAGSWDTLNTCFQEYSIKIYNVNTVVNPIADVTACDSYVLPSIVGPGDYWTTTGGPLGTGSKITLPYTVNSTRTLYVHAEDNNRVACSDEDPFTVTIVKSPDLNPVMAVSVLDSYTIPQYNDPMFTFTATNPGVVNKFYKNPGGPTNNPLATDEYAVGQVIVNSGSTPLVVTLYPYTEALGTGITCFSDEPFVVTINKTLNISKPTFDANSVIVYKDGNKVLNINAGKVVMKNVKIYDLRGRLIYEQPNINTTTMALNDLKAELEVLLIKITSEDNKVVTKKVVF